MPGSVRRAVADDVVTVMRLADAWVEEGITLGQATAPADWFDARLDNYFFVAELDGNVVGFCIGEEATSGETVSAVLPNGSRYLEIAELYVEASRRSAGIGSFLLNAVLDAARRNGIERSMLFTSTSDVAATLRFYERHGYRGWGIQMVR